MSSIEIALEYLRERYPLRRFVPLALLVTVAGMLASPGVARDGGRGLILAYLLILDCRIWDDLEDRAHDAQRHPERITVRVATRAPLAGLAAACCAVALLLLLTWSHPAQRIAALMLLAALLFAWYRMRGATPIANALVVLAKYPVIAAVVAPAALWADRDITRAAPFLLALYLFLCIHEALDDPVLRRSFGRGSPT